MLSSGAQNFFLAEAQKPNLTSTRRYAFPPAIVLLTDGSYGSASPGRTSMPMTKQSSGYAGASTQTETIPSHISILRLRWRGSGSWTKRGRQCKEDLRSIQASPFDAFVMSPMYWATVPSSLLVATARLRACVWPGCPRAEFRQRQATAGLKGPHNNSWRSHVRNRCPLRLTLVRPQPTL